MADAQSAELTDDSPVPEWVLGQVATKTSAPRLREFTVRILRLKDVQLVNLIHDAEQKAWDSCFSVSIRSTSNFGLILGPELIF